MSYYPGYCPEVEKKRRSWRQNFLEYFQIFLVAGILAFLITGFIVQPFMVDGSSMEPTLHNGQRLLVNKFLYRFNPPRTGDIVVFRYPGDVRLRFIKRVIGVPGDRVLIRNGHVFVNGRLLNEEYLRGIKTLGDFGPVKVGAGRLFVLGDNRNNSKDSRYSDVGLVPVGNVVGKAFFVYWPVNDIGVPSSVGASRRP
ncbi:MAG: signal peptidase I [Syntrophothermus sp.]